MSDPGHQGQIQSTPEGGPIDQGPPASEPGAGQVQSTPEAVPLDDGGPLEPPTWREHMRGPIPGLEDEPPGPAAAPKSPASVSREEPPSEELRKWPPHTGKPVSEVPWKEIARYAAPIASQAEQLAIKGIDLSARGLTKLARYLESRRNERG